MSRLETCFKQVQGRYFVINFTNLRAHVNGVKRAKDRGIDGEIVLVWLVFFFSFSPQSVVTLSDLQRVFSIMRQSGVGLKPSEIHFIFLRDGNYAPSDYYRSCRRRVVEKSSVINPCFFFLSISSTYRGSGDATGTFSAPEWWPTRTTNASKSSTPRAAMTGHCRSNMYKRETTARTNVRWVHDLNKYAPDSGFPFTYTRHDRKCNELLTHEL